MMNFLQDIQFGFRMLLRPWPCCDRHFALASVSVRTPPSSASSTRSSCAHCPIPSLTSSSGSGNPNPIWSRHPFPPADFLDYQAQNSRFSQVATIRRLSFNLTGQGAAERIPGMVATPTFFSFGVHPLLGRDFLLEEGAFGAPRVARFLLRFWQSHFAGDAPWLAVRLTLDNQPVQNHWRSPVNFRYGGTDVMLLGQSSERRSRVFSTFPTGREYP